MNKLLFPFNEIKVKSFYVLKFGFLPPLSSDFKTTQVWNGSSWIIKNNDLNKHDVMGEFTNLYNCKNNKERQKDLNDTMGDYNDFKQLVTEAIKLKNSWDIKMCIVWQFYCYQSKNQTEINFLKTLV